jgi:hypothetical protein
VLQLASSGKMPSFYAPKLKRMAFGLAMSPQGETRMPKTPSSLKNVSQNWVAKKSSTPSFDKINMSS